MKRLLRLIVLLLVTLLVLIKSDYIDLTIDFSLEGVEYMIFGYLILTFTFDLLGWIYKKYVFLDLVIMTHILFKLVVGVVNVLRGNVNYNLSYLAIILFITLIYSPIIYFAYKERVL